MNWKLLKYNLTLALALSGIHYYKNPSLFEDHTNKISVVSQEIVSKVKQKTSKVTKTISKNRSIASFLETNENSENIANTSENQESLKKETNGLLNKNSEASNSSKNEKPNVIKVDDELSQETQTKSNEKKSNNPVDNQQINSESNKTTEVNNTENTTNIISGGVVNSSNQNSVSSVSVSTTKNNAVNITPTTPTPSPSPAPSPTPCTPPDSPVGLSVDIILNQPKLSWGSVSNANSYNILRGTSSGVVTLLDSGITSTEYTDTSAISGTTYYYQISSTNSCSESLTSSNEISSTSISPFVILSKTAISNQFSISWSSASGATSYILSYGTNSGVYTQTTSISSPASISVTGGQTYFFKVTAQNSQSTIDSLEESIYVPTDFTDDFNFNNNSDYLLSTGSEISAGVGQLKSNILTSEKTLNGTGNSSGHVFDTNYLISSNLIFQNDFIKMDSGSSAEYISKAFDTLNSQVHLSSLSFNSELPFGKELAISPENGYKGSVSDFSDGLIGLWHLNESSFNNTSGEVHDAKGILNGTSVGTVTSTSGKFDKALNFNGGHNYILVNDHDSLDNLQHLTISTWVYPTILDGTPRGIISKRINSGTDNHSYSMFFYNSNKLSVDIVSTNNRFSSNTIFTPNNWYHLVLVFDGTQISSNRVKLYINGILDTTASENSDTIPATNSNLVIGALNENYGVYYSGKMDETALWSKSLPETQVKELYRRGANRLKFQVRTCDNIDVNNNNCSGNISNWVGPDGTQNSYFTELDNNSNPISKLGTVLSEPFNSLLSKFTAGLTTWLSVGSDATNRYLQYKTIFESDTSLFYPNLAEVSFGPNQRFYTSASIASKSSVKINFSYLTKIEISQSCNDANSNGQDDDIRYAFSFSDNGTYYAFKSGSWTVVSSFSEANTKSELENLTQSEYNLIPSNSGTLSLITYLTSNGTSSCQVDNVKVTGAR